jgi:serine/threonine protein kinase
MVLEYAAGGSVASILAAKSSRALFSPSIRLYTAECLVSAIEYLHSKGIFHRDFKPENMCMHEGWEQTPHMVLIDFGIAKQVPNNFASSTMTSNPGTELFMAPEYADKNVCHFDEKSEVYSIGAVMTCLITGSFSLLALGQAKDCNSQILFHQRDNTGGEWPNDVAMEFANIISQCNSVGPIKRPTVKNLVAAIKNLRSLNGELGRLSPEAINRVQTHYHRSQKSRLPERNSYNTCAKCGLARCHGITCPAFHLVCTESTCMENMARSQMGSSTFRCPGKDCSNEFLLADLYGHINPDLYNELLMAKNQDDNTNFLMNGITTLIQSLHDDFNGMVQLGFSEVKEEIRTSKDEILLSMASQWTLVHYDTALAQASIDQSIEQLKHYAEWLDRKESRLEDKLENLSELEMNGVGNKDDIEKQLQEISTKLENLSLQNAKGVAYLASGRLQCPRLFILWPFRGPRQLRARRLIYKEYRLFFLCEYDKSLVETSVTIKHVRAWLRMVAPFLKFAIFSIRVLVTVYGVPIPQLPDFIPGTNGEEKLNEVIEHTEKLLSDADSQALRSLNNFLEECSDCLNGDKLHALIREHESDIPEEAYGALATIAYKPKNRGWMSEMEIANQGSEYAWVKKANIEAFQSGTAVPRKFC